MGIKNKDFTELIKEIIEPDVVDVSSIQMHDELSPEIWESEDKIKPEIRNALLKNAKNFIETSNLENLKFNDITLTGSLANYNYNEYSDLDVHVLLDYNQISENDDFVGEFLNLKKAIWNNRLPIQVKGHDVEMYYQDNDKEHFSTGVYSLLNDKWLVKPIKKIVNIDTEKLKLKSSVFMEAIDDLKSNKNNDDFLIKYTQLKNKIKKYRQSGLSDKGEFSIENLVFKVLRNTGYLEKMVDIKNEYLTKELSLNEFYVKELSLNENTDNILINMFIASLPDKFPELVQQYANEKNIGLDGAYYKFIGAFEDKFEKDNAIEFELDDDDLDKLDRFMYGRFGDRMIEF